MRGLRRRYLEACNGLKGKRVKETGLNLGILTRRSICARRSEMKDADDAELRRAPTSTTEPSGVSTSPRQVISCVRPTAAWEVTVWEMGLVDAGVEDTRVFEGTLKE